MGGDCSSRKPARTFRGLEKRGLITSEQYLAARVLQQAWRDRGRRARSQKPSAIIGQGQAVFRQWQKPDALGETSGLVLVENEFSQFADPDKLLWRRDGELCSFWDSPLCEFWCDVAEVDWNLLKERLG